MHSRQYFSWMGLFFSVAFLLLGLFFNTRPAIARASPEEYLKTYFELRNQCGMATEQEEGLVEVQGVLRGKIQSNGITTWILSDEREGEGKTYQFVSRKDLPEFVVGMPVRALGRGLAAPGVPIALEMMVMEREMAAWEATRVQKATMPSSNRQPAGVIVLHPQTTPRPALTSSSHTTTAANASLSSPPSPEGHPDSPAGPAPPRWRDGTRSATSGQTSHGSMAAHQRPLTSRRLGAIVEAYKRAVCYFNPRLSPQMADTIARSILAFSAHYGLDPRLVVAVIAVESGFKPNATSHKGAMGLGQLMPKTAAGLGVSNAYDPVENIAGAVRLLRGHLASHAGKPFWERLALALASYNAGSGAVKRHGGVPPYRETQSYIQKVAALYAQLCGLGKKGSGDTGRR